MRTLNISFYRFVWLDDPAPITFGSKLADRPRLKQLRADVKAALARVRADHGPIGGTILLSPEGINGFLGASEAGIRAMQQFLRSVPGLEGLDFKESWSNEVPFNRCLVKLKKELISMGHAEIDPAHQTGSRLDPEMLREWIRQGREFTIVDTRNDYELDVGKFQGAVDLHLKSFREFPEALDQWLVRNPDARERPVVMYCTGGIRCEKATAYGLKAGMKNVYQLEGGILRYFEKCGGEGYEGDCFVFDKRVALTPDLSVSPEAAVCFTCRTVLPDGAESKCPKCLDRGAAVHSDVRVEGGLGA